MMKKGVESPDTNIVLEDEEDSELESGDDKRQFNKFELLGLVEGENEAPGSDGSTDLTQDNEVCDSRPKHNEISNSTQKSGNTKRNRRARRGRGKNSNKTNSDELDEELADLAKAIVAKDQTLDKRQIDNSRFKLLKVDTRNLIPEAELKRIFGRSVVKDDKTRFRAHPGLNLQRSRFVASNYIEAKSSGSFSGPKMELDSFINYIEDSKSDNSVARVSGTSKANFSDPDKPVYFRFVHDKPYQQTQQFFIEAVHLGHSDFIVQNLTTNTSHVESIVQLSHMMRVSQDYKGASDLIEQALVIFERGFHPRFNIATATCRLSYKRPENRTFFITIFKHINCCHRRGLRRTPFEYSKLLLSLEPENDPLMAVQLIDFFAIRSEEFDYLIDFYTQWEQLQKLPNLKFSLALAYFLKSRCTKQSKAENEAYLKTSNELLQEALMLFPNFIIPLLDACSGEPDAALKQCSYFDYSVYSNKYKLVPETIEVLVNLYVKRSFSLWKQKPVLYWLERNVAEMVAAFANNTIHDSNQYLQHWSKFPKVAPKNLLRHIVLCDLDIKIPPSASSSSYIDIDPYPPTDAIITYHTSALRSHPSRSNQGAEGRGSLIEEMSGLFIRSILPSFSLVNSPQSNSSDTVGSPHNDQTTSGNRLGHRSDNSRSQEGSRPSGSGDQTLPADTEAAGRRLHGFDPEIQTIANSLFQALENRGSNPQDQQGEDNHNEQDDSSTSGNDRNVIRRRRH